VLFQRKYNHLSGNIVSGGQRRNIRLTGEIENPEELKIL